MVCAYHYDSYFSWKITTEKRLTFGAKNKHLSLKIFKEKPKSCHQSGGIHIRLWGECATSLCSVPADQTSDLIMLLLPRKPFDSSSVDENTPVIPTLFPLQ
jgi:hypothetical protein